MYLEISFHIRWATLYYFVLLLTPLLVSKSSLLQWRWWTNEVAYFCTPFIQSTDDQLTNEQERSVHAPIDVTGCLCTYEDMEDQGQRIDREQPHAFTYRGKLIGHVKRCWVSERLSSTLSTCVWLIWRDARYMSRVFGLITSKQDHKVMFANASSLPWKGFDIVFAGGEEWMNGIYCAAYHHWWWPSSLRSKAECSLSSPTRVIVGPNRSLGSRHRRSFYTRQREGLRERPGWH